MAEQLRLGIVGASTERGWAMTAHLPALAHLPRYRLQAVATTRTASAEATARAHGAERAYDDGVALARADDVDVVAVTVRVPYHEAVVRAALEAGKHVLCEWPLTPTAAQAASLLELAEARGVRHLVGLQGWHAPGTDLLTRLVAEGAVGPVESVSLVTSGRRATTTTAARAFMADVEAGANLLTIGGGHSLAVLVRALGPLASVSAELRTLDPTVTVEETGEVLTATAPDQVVATGIFASGAVLAYGLHSGGGASARDFRLQVVGRDATLQAGPARPGGSIHIDPWVLTLGRGQDPAARVELPEAPSDLPPGPAAHVTLLYRELAAAIDEGRPAAPGFDVALRHHLLLEAVRRASDTGRRQQLG